MSEFSDKPFVAGSLTGVRAFGVDRLGRLYGPSYYGIFTPDVNVAKCYVGQTLPKAPRGSVRRTDASSTCITGSFTITSGSGWFSVPDEPVPTCRGYLAKDCNCGFYAYFYERADYGNEVRAHAIIEGFGSCVVGDSGFRAEKARLVAFAGFGENIDPKYIERVKRNYPDVPVFNGIEKAIAEFPLTPVDTSPTYDPETDPEFWTRELE